MSLNFFTRLFRYPGARRGRFLRHALWLMALGAAFTLLFTVAQPFYTISLWFADQFYSSSTASTNIVIVGIDDASLQVFGRLLEWPRGLHAQAINNLKSAGATVIGYDVLFADSASEDDELAAAIAAAGNVLLAGSGGGSLPSSQMPIYDEFLQPTPKLAAACVTAHVNVVSDPDGKVRRLPLMVSDNTGATYPALSAAMLYTLFHITVPADMAPTAGKLEVVGREVPVDQRLYMCLNYASNITSLPYLSYADVVRGDFDPAVVKGRLVLVGSTASGEDTWAIPTSSVRIPGMLIHAAALDTILSQRFLVDTGRGWTLLILLGITVLLAIVLPATGTRNKKDIFKMTAAAVLFAGGYLVFSSVSAAHGRIVNVLYPSLTVVVLYTGSIVYAIIQEQTDKRFVKELFGRYVSPEVSRAIVSMADSGGLKLGGEEREVSVLFADIRGFTTISERMTPGEVVAMLNTCLPLIIEAVSSHGGMVNKFAGDCIMGVWNAPNHVPDHALLALKAAWEAQKKMTANMQSAGSEIRFGIGINTGKAIAGNLGSTGRSEYTVIGDTVNLASRICGATAGGEVCIGPETYQRVMDSVQVDILEPQTFKGKAKPVQVYRVTGWKKDS